MKKKGILASICTGVGIAAFIFCAIGVVFDIRYGGNFQLSNYSFTKMAAGTLAVGLGFGAPTAVYNNENMSVTMQTLIHMGIGCVVLTAVGLLVGWIPTENGPMTAVLMIAGEIAVALVIWYAFYRHYKKMAIEMNRRIKEMNS
ncbi:MAG: DUF3021 domain-containing protein [Anaerovoracaceae bacterium]|nr:DUF3021 domain-containing protein [Anaerovoracaceae bacterium]